MLNDMINGINPNINVPKQIGSPEVLEIGENIYVSTTLYEKRGNRFYDVSFINKDKEFFIGRFDKEDSAIKIDYKDGKILIYLNSFNRECEKMVITKVLSLYDILDDTTYACTEEEALKLFDNNIDTKYLQNKDNLIIRRDVEKRNRLK